MAISYQLGRERQVLLPAGDIDYRERGAGPTVVFVHGLLVNGDLWRDVSPRLADRYRCVTPDWPLGAHSTPVEPDADLSLAGLGRIVADFLKKLELEDVTLVGNDTGGAICQYVAVHHPERVARLVLTSCDAFECYPPRPFGFLPWMGRIPGLLALSANTMRLRPLRSTPLALGLVMRRPPEKPVSDSYVTPGYRGEIRHDTRRVLSAIDRRDTLALAERFQEFKKPVLIAWGEDDRLFSQELSHRLAAAFPDARRVGVPQARTFVPEDEPKRLADLIAAFIETTPTRARRATVDLERSA
jgi:pimeloyl-ACP methyl ester carboxylesterase